jgi:hypothetical protein
VSAPISIVILRGPSLTIVGENATFRRLLGREPTGIPISELCPIVPVECLETFRRVYASGEAEAIEVWSPLRDTDVTVYAFPLVRYGRVSGVAVEVHPAALPSLGPVPWPVETRPLQPQELQPV